MLIVKVTFKIPKDLDLETLKGKFEETAPMYRDTKGLIRKNYICDLDKSIGVGIYCFDNRENADAWFDDDRIEWLKKPFNSDDKKDINDTDDETIITLLIQRYLFDEIIYEKDGKVIDRAK